LHFAVERARHKLQYFKDNIDKPLAAILTLNTFAHTIGAIGVGTQATLIWHDSNPYITGVVVPIIMTLAILILSEVIPKTVGANYWRSFAAFTVYSLTILVKLLYPLVWICQLITKVFRPEKNRSIFSRTDFVAMAEIGEMQGVLHADESDLIEHTLDLYEIRVPEVMRPVVDMIMVEVNESIPNLLKLVKTYRYSRYPVYEDATSNIIGILHIKDLLASDKRLNQQTIRELIRPVLKVKNTLQVKNLLRRFKEGMPHFALVYDGNQQLIGFITLDNVLHVLLGIIKDEFNKTHVAWKLNNDGSITASGFCSIFSLEQALDLDLDVPEGIETISGLIIDKVETLPEKDKSISFEAFDVKITKVDKTRIVEVVIYPKH
jgi:CBS domain containing-hemolysin-like protein